MDSIWGDPWADNAEPDLPEQKKNDASEVTTYEPVKPQTTLFAAGFEDEAGWGEFEESTGFGTVEAEGSGKQESESSAGQGHGEETGFTNGLAPETTLRHTNGSGILSPGWGDSHALSSTPEPLPNEYERQNDDTSEIPPSPVWESPRSSLSSIPYASKTLDSKDSTPGTQSVKLDEHVVTGTPPRPGTSSTTETAVSTDSNAFSEVPTSPIHHDGSRWERKLSRSDPTDGSNNSLDSIRTSFDEAYVSSKRTEESASYMEQNGHLSTADVDSLRNTVHADEEHESIQEEKPRDEVGLDHVQAVVKGPRFNASLNLVNKIFQSAILSENHEQANDEVIDSTSTRKAWYRLTRPQTMREFNTGATDDSYVRVSWPKSHIRTETLKIATRWASEDRINGRVVLGGKPGAAIFGWEVPSDGSIIPPRPMSMINPLPQRKESGEHRVSHQRQSSMPHPSNYNNPSPVAQFGWSTSPINGMVASFGDVLGARATPTTPESQAGVGTHRKVVQTSGSATAQSPLPIARIHKEKKVVRASGLSLENEQDIDPPGLSKLDTSEPTLNASLEDDDDDWGEMVKSPSGPLPPMASPSFPASAVETNPSNIDEHIPIISTRRRPTPIMAPPVAHSSPDSMLSPARKAALDAARATRFLNSQPTRIGSPTIGDSEFGSSIFGSHRLSPSPSPSMRASLNLERLLSPNGSMKSATGIAPIASSSFLESDLSFFETPTQQPISPHPTRDLSTPVQLSAKEEGHAQTIVRKIPNLSFMLR